MVSCEQHVRQFLAVIDLSDRCDRIGAVMGADDQRLRFIIADTADAESSLHLHKVLFKLGSEIGTLDIMNCAVKSLFPIIHRHTGPSCAEVGMIIRSIKQIKDDVFTQCCAKKSTHTASF